jgi:hypothetical protein
MRTPDDQALQVELARSLPPSTWRRRITALFTRPKLPAWAIILLQLIQWVPDWKSRIEFWLDTARSMGGYVGTAATLVASPYFNAGLLVFAVAWLFFFGEPARGVQRDPRWRYVGWSIFAISLIAIGVTAGYGAIEIYIREQIASRQSTILHDGTSRYAPPQPVDPGFSFQRRLSPDQFRALVQQAAKLKSDFPSLLIAIPPGDNEAWVLAKDFHDALVRGGVLAGDNQNMMPQGPEETGVMIAVPIPHDPPAGAQRLREALEIIGIVPHFVENKLAAQSSPANQVILFIGPKPI